MTCKSIVMSYKDNCKTEGPVITRLKIARHYFADGIAQKDIAQDIGCHKNTDTEIIKLCKNQPDSKVLWLLSGNAKIETVLSDIMGLTKLNYNSCQFADGLPVTLRFADAIGEILTAGPSKESSPLPFKYYI